ncbi:saccharopine dehydrogenase [Limnochorda pilosa]|uniref:Saccharopine dehydrogenase n=2 Tax=Limnochorda pilosa TaxID=1555112 RepID=A0A0K2SMB9_LIMPI|nr:saccharopine dehydrogenase [Limnochorda pilosa]
MRVLVLGAAGDMGSRAVRELAREASVDEIGLADRNVAAAQALAAELPSGRARPMPLDARDASALRSALAGWDVAASALGPFYLFEAPAVRAAIQAGVPYVSLCDDHDAAQAALALHPTARERGVTVVTGMGWTPGLSNLLARRAAGLLDRALRVRIAWAGAASDSKGYAVILHTMHMLTGQVPTFRDRRYVLVPAGSEPEVLPFPEPLGQVKVAHVGHPEPVTLPRSLPGVEEVSLRGGLSEAFLNWLATALARGGLTRSARGKALLGSTVKPLLPLLERIGPAGASFSGLHVVVEGVLREKPTRVTVRAIGHMADLTGVPLAVAALLLGSGEARLPGVHAPEAPGLFDADAVLRNLAGRGLSLEEPVIEALRDRAGAPASPARR